MKITKDNGDQGVSSLEISNEFGLNAPVNKEVIDRVATSEIISDVESTQKEMNCQTGNLRFHEMPRYMLQALSKKNGIRANLTNDAMANALHSLDTVIGIEMINTEKRSSKRATTLEDGKIIEKAI